MLSEIISEWWEQRAFLNAFFIFSSVFFKFSKIKQVYFYKNKKRHKKKNGEEMAQKRRTKNKVLKGDELSPT